MINVEHVKDYTTSRALDLLKWKLNTIYLKTSKQAFDSWVDIMKDFNKFYFGDIGVTYTFNATFENHIIIARWICKDKDGFNFGFSVALDEFTLKQLYIPEV